MSNYKYDSIVSSQETQALKEMIFKRARERAAAMANDAQESYTTNLHADVMDVARDSFKSTKNPFALDNYEKTDLVELNEKKVAPNVSNEKYQDGLGFSQKSIDMIKAQINYRNKIVVEKVASEAVQTNMADAREDFTKKSSFMGALDFLNSQATISLVKSKGAAFDAIA